MTVQHRPEALDLTAQRPDLDTDAYVGVAVAHLLAGAA